MFCSATPMEGNRKEAIQIPPVMLDMPFVLAGPAAYHIFSNKLESSCVYESFKWAEPWNSQKRC